MRRWAMTSFATLMVVGVWACSTVGREGSGVEGGDAAERVHRALFVRLDANGREVGQGAMDPMLFHDTRHLLEGESHAEAVRALDGLVRAPAEAMGRVERAMVQQDLWAVFDWASREREGEEAPGRKILRRRLAEGIRHVAMADGEIAKLPDNYRAVVESKRFPAAFDAAKPGTGFLPGDLFDENGPWVCVGAPRSRDVVATDHAIFFEGRSSFLVFMNLPGGRAATVAYLEKLSSVPKPTWQSDRDDTLRLVDDLPQFPDGTQVALVRRMMLVDDRGRVVPTALMQSVQFRVFHGVRPGHHLDAGDQRFFEFVLDRKALLARRGGLRQVGAEEQMHGGFSSVAGEGDPIEAARAGRVMHHRPMKVMESCTVCHRPSGIYSVNSFSNNNSAAKADPHLLPTTVAEEVERARAFARRRAGVGMLRGMMEGRDGTR